MQVLKFGGTSVANVENMSRVADIVTKAVDRDRTILVCSAISGFTDALIRTGRMAAARDEAYKSIIDEYQEKHYRIIHSLIQADKQRATLEACDAVFESLRGIARGVCLLGELSEASLDAIQGCGELLSTRIMAVRLASEGIPVKWVDSREIIRTVRKDGVNVVDTAVSYANMVAMLERNPVTSLFVLPGFIASDSQGRTTTLGRGGSDYSASLLAVGCGVRRLEIWTDVPGMMTANPKTVPTARTISNISYRAALELSHFGAKVIYPPTIQPVVSEGIPIYVKDTFDPDAPGTLIEKNPPRSKERLVGISNSDNIALISLEGSGMVGVPGFSARLFEALSRSGINIILITQASSVHTMCVAIPEKDAEKAREAADSCFAYEISLGKLNPLKVEQGYSIVCLVGDDILSQCGTTGRMLDALGRHGIPIRATAQGSSERNISVVVRSSEADRAIRYIHNEFFDRSPLKDINLFITGYGTVGKALVDIIRRNGDVVAARTGKRLRIAGIANSRRYVLDPEGIAPERAGELLAQGLSAADDAWTEALAHTSLENSVFVDCTASADIACRYASLFRHGYSVVACNKIAFSAPLAQYRALRKAALESGAGLRYETTVGAALPVLESVASCVCSGDRIHRVEAVLSGTLNYIFSTYDGGKSVTFAEVVRQAVEKGYAEPDPRIDLSGRDVLRKLLILGREAGAALEEGDVEAEPLLPQEYFRGSVEDFYKALEDNEKSFAEQYHQATSRGLRLRFVASLERVPLSGDECCGASPCRWKACIALEALSPEHPLYSLEGTDNAVILTTDFYPSPLVIRGAGAGAYQTASGVLNDILK